jgi:hypothetical protein
MPTDDYSTHVMAYLAEMVRNARKNAADAAQQDQDEMLTYFAGLADGIETALESLKHLLQHPPPPKLN